MKPFQQEFDRIESDLNINFNSLNELVTKHGYSDLQETLTHLGKAILSFRTFKEEDTREGCHRCGKPLTDNYSVVDDDKFCYDCAKDIRRKNNYEKYR